MHKIEQQIQSFLERIESSEVSEELIEEFGERCKGAIRECLLVKRGEEPFKLRMSNIGKPLRQLQLEKEHGRAPMDAQLRLKMTYGFLWESFVLFLLKASGLDVKVNEKVKLDIGYEEGKKLTLKGTTDLEIDGEIYDIKSASSWSFDNKFQNFAKMEEDDPFGYCGQALGYSIATKKYFGGWIVIDKSDGRIKVVSVPKEGYRELALRYLDDFKRKIKAILNNEEIPPCEGEVEESFRKKVTGNRHLSKTCEFCPHKHKCHPGLVYKPAVMSEAQNRPWRYYTRLVNLNE